MDNRILTSCNFLTLEQLRARFASSTYHLSGGLIVFLLLKPKVYVLESFLTDNMSKIL